MRGDASRGGLKLEELVAEDRRNLEFPQAGPRVLRQVIGHLEIDVIGRNRVLPRPTLFDDVG